MSGIKRIFTSTRNAAGALNKIIKRRGKKLLIQAVLLLVIGLAVWIYFFLQPGSWRYYTDELTFSELAKNIEPHFVAWEDAELLPAEFNNPAENPKPAISPDGTKMVFARKGKTGTSDLFFSVWNGISWSQPTPLRALNSLFNESDPAFGRDGNSLFFSSDRPGGPGGYDIWISRWDGAEFAWPLPLTVMINSPFDEIAPEPSAGDGRLFFSSNKPNRRISKEEGKTLDENIPDKFKDLDFDIFVAERIPAGVTNREVERATSMLYHLRERALADKKVMKILGGSDKSEKAVDKAIVWLAKVQEDDGRWDIRKHGGSEKHTVGGSAFALLVFLGRGERPDRDGKYKDTVNKALEWLISQQNPVEGDLRGKRGDMYDHGIASLALAEAYGMTKHEDLLIPAQAAIDFIVQSQNLDSGGWRYTPGQKDSDLSVSGWMIMALKSAQLSGLHVPEESFVNIRKWLKRVSGGKKGGLYGYQNGGGNRPAMVATGYFCCQLMGLSPNTFRSFETADFLKKNNNANKITDSYFCYYATLSAYQNQGPLWREWQKTLQNTIPGRQNPQGFWQHTGPHANEMGHVVYSSLMALCLQAHYRYTPLYGIGYEPNLENITVSTKSRDDLTEMPVYRRARRMHSINSSGDDIQVCATMHGDLIYFASNRDDGMGGFDIYRSRVSGYRPTEPVNVGPTINSEDDETGPAIRMNGFNMIFGSNRKLARKTKYRLYGTTSRRVFKKYSKSIIPGWRDLGLVWKQLTALSAVITAFVLLLRRRRSDKEIKGVTKDV